MNRIGLRICLDVHSIGFSTQRFLDLVEPPRVFIITGNLVPPVVIGLSVCVDDALGRRSGTPDEEDCGYTGSSGYDGARSR